MLNVKPLLPDFVGAVEGFSTLGAVVLSFGNAGAVVLTGVMAGAAVGGLAVAGVLFVIDETACFGVADVLVGTGVLCTAGGLAAGPLGTAILVALVGAIPPTDAPPLPGVGTVVVETGLGTAGFSCFVAGGCFKGGTAGWVTSLATGLDGVGVALDECPAELVLLVL